MILVLFIEAAITSNVVRDDEPRVLSKVLLDNSSFWDDLYRV
jgi:hypothetical protein